MKCQLIYGNEEHEKPKGFLYVGQDNYYIGPKNSEITYLYSDSATSCIIVIIEGTSIEGEPMVALTHLSRLERFKAFFDLVESTFHGEIHVFAQGANPPELADTPSDTTSLRNMNSLLTWINVHSSTDDEGNIVIPPSIDYKYNNYIKSATLSLGMGDPQKFDRGCYGIDLTTMIVSNKRFDLTLEDRDPTHGEQTLFCVFGLKVTPPIVLHNVLSPFSKNEVDLLVKKAKDSHWEEIAGMTDQQILENYSSTPQYEASWFCDTMRESSNYVIHYKG